MNMHPVLKLCRLSVLALIATPLLAQTEPGNLMKVTVTSKMQMPGMANMPARTSSETVCTSVKKPDPRQLMKKNKNCTVSNYQQAGGTISYHMACTGRMQMSGDGKFEMLSGGNVRGQIQMHMANSAGGRTMSMKMSYDGQRIGSCEYTPPKAGK